MPSSWPRSNKPTPRRRAYHHFGNVRALLEHYAEVAAGPGWQQPVEVWLAVLFQDEEYRGHVPSVLFRLNRQRFLSCLLKRPRIFLSDHVHTRYDAAAPANLRRRLGR
ncbi:hypothetical protein PD5205_02547 [Xanthomonas fragariae]|uniref:Uncharacterized protein n=1 Tax=Xanthomonas fragariae TaxID=48664 RepID=A0A1Y6H5R4_9XANT|nr:hypothetical protein O1K_20232 [Xanthomonas fragariae LMG 25863]SMQ95872.1 hypothetical protein NBC2815_02544 [Xanthomonas fragariae]SMQ98697.1 hypothetical protein PD885_01447 [Xanthomonas fragariae]SMR03838.1 hypothetical protein PD5205_02547 [Xanthomonas fragariae]